MIFLASSAFVGQLQNRQQYYSDRADHAHRVKSQLLQMNTIGMAYVTSRKPVDKQTFLLEKQKIHSGLKQLDLHRRVNNNYSFETGANEYFQWLEQAFRTRELLGLDHESGLEGGLRNAVHAIEEDLFQLNDHELAVKMLMMRRHEKDFMMRLDSKYLTRHVQRAEEFQGILANRDYTDTLKLSLLSLLKTYRADFRQWASARLKFEVELTTAQDDFDKLIAQLSDHAEWAMSEYDIFTQRQKQTLAIMNWLTWLSVVAFSAICLLATWYIGQSIANPIRKIALDMLALCVQRTGNSEQFRSQSRNEVAHLENVLAYFRETLEQTDRLHLEVRYHRDNLSTEVLKRTQELKEQTFRLEQALKQEKELNEMTNQFVSTVSHEFRTPLTIIDAVARRVSKRLHQMDEGELRERMDRIRDSAQRLSQMVESTLDAAKLASGQMAFNQEDVDVSQLLEDVIDRHREIAPGFKINVHRENVPDTIRADSRLLDHVFANLVSNAIKYSKDRPEVDVIIKGTGSHVDVRVRDRGVGIPKKELPHIAERFYRASTSKGIKGTGIGLNLVTQLVELHSGCFCIDSEEGEWTEVTVRLPITGQKPCDSDYNDAVQLSERAHSAA